MTYETKVVSLKFMGAEGAPIDYVMIEGQDVDEAKRVAAQWAEQNVTKPFDWIEEHQGVIAAPDIDEDDILESVRIWHLPF